MKDIRIAVRVTAKEKEKIQSKARKCGLSTTEYVKQRALGYEPRGIPPDALFRCLEKLSELAGKASSPELDKEIYAVLKQITAEFLLPGKGCLTGSPQSLLCWEYFCIFTNCHLSLQNPTDKGFSIFYFHKSPLIATYCHGQMS